MTFIGDARRQRNFGASSLLELRAWGPGQIYCKDIASRDVHPSWTKTLLAEPMFSPSTAAAAAAELNQTKNGLQFVTWSANCFHGDSEKAPIYDNLCIGL